MHLMKTAVLIAVLGLAVAAPNDLENEVEQSSPFDRFARMLSACVGNGDDVTSCLAIKGITALNRAARMKEVQVFNGVQFERDTTVSVRDGKSLESESEVASTLPKDPVEKTGRLMSMFMESASNFLQSHNLQVKLAPEEIATAARTFNEARGKIKKLLGPILLGAGVKILAVLAIVGGGLFLLVSKALIVAKLAFVLASILGLQKLFSGENGSNILGKVTNQGWNGGAAQGWSNAGTAGWSQNTAAASASYPYARSIEAQDLAYAAQKQ